ncbi:diacylglycerol kinase catalytic region [Cellulophaga algicola DSM 14237]|uniref:Diacylglycerol kinase catalytic region n=1 Tax=Cellulophaga algicola (strain DSM 14237 / IC166 / ACAM 630) TaxID=688270 RepID=E6XDG1_CELAD|nr:diacylglycerol kinase family protein [Cellulophaga algicola]ADV49093.1 diacylglycerol kinase catalytic region [Cellulophaga algicola DSM 14237]
MIQIHFIVNPIAGHGSSSLSKAFLESYFIGSVHQITVKYSEYKKHAIQLTKESIEEKAAIIVACGGDGTINEVASCLVGIAIPLGIIPIGSGNGLASNLKIPKNLRKALAVIRSNRTIKMDVGKINNRFFFSNTGVGFDAEVIKHYESKKKRSFLGYVYACLTSIKKIEHQETIEISFNNEIRIINPFIILISNSNEMGYHLSLTPKASLQDGLLDVLIISKINRLKIFWLGILVLIGKINWLNEAKNYQVKALELSRNDQSFLESQIDGEFHKLEKDSIKITVIEKALSVLVPS